MGHARSYSLPSPTRLSGLVAIWQEQLEGIARFVADKVLGEARAACELRHVH
jgi:hypothetical protein